MSIRKVCMSFSIQKTYTYLTEETKSKFLAYAIPLKNVEEFKPILNDIRKEHKKAKHVVYAYKVGMSSKSCDDQEPKGTAGRPMLELINKRNLDQIALVVVRYFGGVKLGASKLLRTYVTAANAALNAAELIEM